MLQSLWKNRACKGKMLATSSNVQQYIPYKVSELVGPPNINCHYSKFDAGALLHISQPASQPCRERAFKAEERGTTSFEI
jgi:hypothetical protein